MEFYPRLSKNYNEEERHNLNNIKTYYPYNMTVPDTKLVEGKNFRVSERDTLIVQMTETELCIFEHYKLYELGDYVENYNGQIYRDEHRITGCGRFASFRKNKLAKLTNLSNVNYEYGFFSPQSVDIVSENGQVYEYNYLSKKMENRGTIQDIADHDERYERVVEDFYERYIIPRYGEEVFAKYREGLDKGLKNWSVKIGLNIAYRKADLKKLTTVSNTQKFYDYCVQFGDF